MKKITITLTLLFAFFFAGNAQTPSDSKKNKGQNHRGHNLHGKGDQHQRGIRLFHGHYHHGKGHARQGVQSNHGKGRQGDNESKDNK
jgi:hypothetical protein